MRAVEIRRRPLVNVLTAQDARLYREIQESMYHNPNRAQSILNMVKRDTAKLRKSDMRISQLVEARNRLACRMESATMKIHVNWDSEPIDDDTAS